MAIFIRWIEVPSGKYLVNYQCFDPSILSEEDKADGILVDSLPQEPVVSANESLVGLFVDPATLPQEPDANTIYSEVKLWYEVGQKPLTNKERISKLEFDKATSEAKISELSERNRNLESSNKALSDTVDGLIAYMTEAGIL